MISRLAANQRRYRARLRDGRRCVTIEVDEDRLGDLLVTLRILTPAEADDPTALRAGLERFLELQFRVLSITP